jgi:hypothetical protein
MNKKTTELRVVTNVANANDLVLFVWKADHVADGLSETAVIRVSNFFANVPGIVLKDFRDPPAHSDSLPDVIAGTLFFANSYGYIATEDGHLKRFSLSDFEG